VLLLILFAVTLIQGYTLQTDLTANGFFNNFDFWNANDPTNGYVNYLSQSDASRVGLISGNGKTFYIGSDHVNKSVGRGRNSVRMQTKANYNTGLFVLDLAHMPTGCGTWPAWWLCGPNWPNQGEIDIIEGVNTQTTDATTLHTKNGCSISEESKSLYTGTLSNPNCYINAPNQPNNAGCGIQAGANSYGAPFNNNGGGVFALEWTNSFIRSFFFPHNAVPADLNSASPNPNGWGKPYAHFALGAQCPSNYFSNMNLIFDLTFCGDWAGNVFASQCPGKGSCNSYVQNNPADFKDAYWEVNYLKVYRA